jgi:hypothetical protein
LVNRNYSIIYHVLLCYNHTFDKYTARHREKPDGFRDDLFPGEIMNKVLILLGVAVVLSACNGVGSAPATPTIAASVTTGNCGNFTTTGESCVITIAYNTNGASGPSLTYTPNPLPIAITTNGSFNTTFGTCQTNVSNAGSGAFTCPVTIVYTSNVGGANFNLAFVLSSTNSSISAVTSNTIAVSGN